MSNNLYICDTAGCPTVNVTSTAGNIFVENASVFGNNFSLNQTSSTSLGTFDNTGTLIMTFEPVPTSEPHNSCGICHNNTLIINLKNNKGYPCKFLVAVADLGVMWIRVLLQGYPLLH